MTAFNIGEALNLEKPIRNQAEEAGEEAEVKEEDKVEDDNIEK